ncbi:hypothetical protein AX769_02910 [Frondihabitans sp. PAMC 28766]|uniref:ABC transporter permease n=1 Tax=Frondihabitans sp. PAMC 28766 TaxID=1795630 RepID=UPI00078D8B5A|nr:ABC transporter permease [Frondihabitans sp. PAMC 28766]AMM19277.1 hypothetical protein AX769_02910 [Frondihabitans sp. PAMC 28766]
MRTISLTPLQPAPRPSHRGIVRSELLKLTSLRSVRLAFLVAVVTGVVGAVVQAGDHPGLSSAALGSGVFSSAVIAVIGAIAGSSEYATRTVQPSLMAVPNRLVFVAAKAGVMAAVGAILSVVCAVLGLVVTGVGVSAAAAVALLGCAVFGAASGAFAVFFSLVVRSAAGSVAGILGLTVLLPGLVGGVKIGSDLWATDFTMSEAGGGLALATDGTMWLGGAAVLVVWLAVGAIAATLRITRSDA